MLVHFANIQMRLPHRRYDMVRLLLESERLCGAKISGALWLERFSGLGHRFAPLVHLSRNELVASVAV
jgi:hypothetical protein